MGLEANPDSSSKVMRSCTEPFKNDWICLHGAMELGLSILYLTSNSACLAT